MGGQPLDPPAARREFKRVVQQVGERPLDSPAIPQHLVSWQGLCDREEPVLRELAAGHSVACHLAE